MIAVYFDTSVYNKISDVCCRGEVIKDICSSVRSGKISILFSVLNLEELSHTRDTRRRKALFELADSICYPRMLRGPEDIVKRDIEVFLSSGNIDYKIFDDADWEDLFRRARTGTLFKDVPGRVFQEMKKRKKEFRKFMQKSQKKLSSLWTKHRSMDFDDFYQGTLNNTEGRQMLRDICVKALQDPIKGEQAFHMLDLQKIASLRFLFKTIVVLAYRQLLKGIQPKWGDNIDINHSVYLGCCDAFVTADSDFLESILLLNEPIPLCFDFEQFLNACVNEK